jgi:hypothetical protein
MTTANCREERKGHKDIVQFIPPLCCAATHAYYDTYSYWVLLKVNITEEIPLPHEKILGVEAE